MEDVAGEPQVMNEQPTNRRSAQSSVTRGLVIQGNLIDTALPETVQFLQSLRKTGQLALERGSPRESAAISFVDGRVVHAVCPPDAGESCFMRLLTWRDGRYVFLPNHQPREQTIDRDTNALLLDGLRLLDEVNRYLERLPPRGTVLYRRRDPDLLRRAQFCFAQLRVWRRLDGRATIGELVDADPGCAQHLFELVAAGLATPTADYRFLSRLILVGSQRGAAEDELQARDLASPLLRSCDGRRTLADQQRLLGCHPESMLAAAEYLLAMRLVQVAGGAEEAKLLA